MPKRKPEPVTETEVAFVVLRTLATAFGDRPLDQDTARRGLAMAANKIVNLHMREVAEKEKG
jgi:hypothetical protein